MRILFFMTCFMLAFQWQAMLAQAEPVEMANSLLDAGKVNEAVILLKQETGKNPGDFQRWFLLGVAQAKKQAYEQAIVAFKKVIELRPDLAEPHNNLAVIYNEQGNVQAAVSELEASLKIRPDYPMAEENIADMYVKMALDHYQKALATKSDDKKLAGRYALLQKIHETPAPDVESAGDSGSAVESASTDVQSNKVQPHEDRSQLRAAVLNALEGWRSAWASRDADAYFAYYAENFHPAGKYSTIPAWKAYKRRVITNKKFIEVALSDTKLIFDHDHFVTVQFRQSFRSDSFSSEDNKALVWQRQGNEWKIISEGSF
ncbi:MAG: hypothetical protein CO186_10150 [Zetaproteobacteria bacterium CG_4_9_14_3_um_filter_49_83]|nr:MAG: hypothetical protein AUJ56_02930 [Zetaproteobacteria bacterium CG1_02_49_23]PIQ34501.1 MAG: hypothetical protein COW62_01475 [Zetaproteobacteria bacterium CG17_big_fil_post_rev_8_21_14_2_50_50_13]PIV29789.1 MAG: hypothetical protein COS35_10200 [Zetaproteobacteria bacterium CG02_land_8_20_14_3_00_50_9]PIY56072.1 MAG: hypothetical protein COZ00_05910 [Zetaproteobacteria bacterium CG_4_10_14_0_8_um_filter_49_80]PJA34512.1 MAG: hypothetical protein CO186_10150 [Zetaproteobacteria bacterium